VKTYTLPSPRVLCSLLLRPVYAVAFYYADYLDPLWSYSASSVSPCMMRGDGGQGGKRGLSWRLSRSLRCSWRRS
jgi:hypothetical protein